MEHIFIFELPQDVTFILVHYRTFYFSMHSSANSPHQISPVSPLLQDATISLSGSPKQHGHETPRDWSLHLEKADLASHLW